MVLVQRVPELKLTRTVHLHKVGRPRRLDWRCCLMYNVGIQRHVKWSRTSTMLSDRARPLQLLDHAVSLYVSDLARVECNASMDDPDFGVCQRREGTRDL